MRLNVLSLTALLPLAGLLSGCAMGTQGITSSAAATPAVKSMKGKAFGGQQAVSNGTIAVYEYGANGYGSSGAAIATTTTDSAGNFKVNYTCTNPNAPVYVLSIGGSPGLHLPNNAAIVLGAGIGSCAASDANPFVTINEISTTALAFSLSHFFSSTSTDVNTSDHFGGPASLTPAITRVNSVLIPTLIDVTNGYPMPSTGTFTIESAKIITVADILGACVNSLAPDSPSCLSLFSNTKNGTTPTNTLEAAVNIALSPSQNVAALYSLVPPSGSSAFSGSLTTQPNDWTLAVSYSSSGFGLGVDPYTVSTLDIDSTGRVWFPSNIAGSGGVAYFDPNAGSFSPLFTAPGLLHPEQVVVDINGEVWATDLQSPVVAGFPGATPTTPIALSLPGTYSTAITVLDDNSLRVGLVNISTNGPSFGAITNGTTYAQVPNTMIPGAAGFIGASLAGDTVGGVGISGTDDQTPATNELYLNPNSTFTNVLFRDFRDSGQVAFTGTNLLRHWAASPTARTASAIMRLSPASVWKIRRFIIRRVSPSMAAVTSGSLTPTTPPSSRCRS